MKQSVKINKAQVNENNVNGNITYQNQKKQMLVLLIMKL